MDERAARETREARLKAALKANIGKRKAQARARADKDDAAGEGRVEDRDEVQEQGGG